jgi:hypothetical protein
MVLQLIDMVIVMTLCEVLLLGLYHRQTGRGVAPGDFMPSLVAGLALMLAVRAGISDAGWGWMSAALLCAGLAHMADLRRRWNRR